MPLSATETLPHVIAGTNAAAAVFLAAGRVLVKRGNEAAHRRAMLLAFGTSCVFLVAYVTYHLTAEPRFFPETEAVALRTFYLVLLATHVVLAATVPVLAIWTLKLGLSERREAHRRLARWTWPIWMYVSVTGVMVYAMLQVYA
jgi:uncharacterized membrane protein YozB (DUF420 family)